MSVYPISEEQVRFYHDNGYVVLPDVLTADELDDLRRSLDEAMQMPLQHATDHAQGDYAKIFRQRVNLWRDHEGIRRFVLNPKVAEIARRLAGVSGVRLWHDHAL